MSSQVKTILAANALLALSIHNNANAINVFTGYHAVELTSNVNDGSFTQFEGITKHGNSIYVGNFRTVQEYNLSTGKMSTYGSVPGNNGISQLSYTNGQVYMAHFTSYTAPYPYNFGSVGSGSSFTDISTVHGLYDMDSAPSGNMYYVSNPDTDGDDSADGSRIFRYDVNTGNTTEIAYVGGASGGLTFDTAGNLYYAHYDNNMVYRFNSSDLGVGSLSLAQADSILSVTNPGYIDFDNAGNLLVNELNQSNFTTTLSSYDLDSGVGTAIVSGGLHFLQDGSTTYVIEQSWDFSGDYGSKIHALTPVPEPSIYGLLMGVCALGYIGGRRKR